MFTYFCVLGLCIHLRTTLRLIFQIGVNCFLGVFSQRVMYFVFRPTVFSTTCCFGEVSGTDGRTDGHYVYGFTMNPESPFSCFQKVFNDSHFGTSTTAVGAYQTVTF